MNLTMLMNEGQCTSNLRDDGPNLPDSKVRSDFMNKNCRANTLIVLIQINGTELHIDKEIRRIWKVSEVKDFDDIVMPAIAQPFDCP